MDVILILVIVASVFFVGAWALIIAYVGAYFAFHILPPIVGVCLGIVLWYYGHDNLGVIVGIASFVLFPFWMKLLGGRESEEAPYDPMRDKIKIYDADGEVVGYRDRD